MLQYNITRRIANVNSQPHVHHRGYKPRAFPRPVQSQTSVLLSYYSHELARTHARLFLCRKTTSSFHTGSVFLPANTTPQYATSSLALLKANKSREYQGMNLTNKAPVRGGGGTRREATPCPRPCRSRHGAIYEGRAFCPAVQNTPPPCKIKKRTTEGGRKYNFTFFFRSVHSTPFQATRSHGHITPPTPPNARGSMNRFSSTIAKHSNVPVNRTEPSACCYTYPSIHVSLHNQWGC